MKKKNHIITKAKKYQRAITLLEVMIALSISSVLIVGILQIFLANKHNYRTMNALAGLQENSRFALMLVSKAVRGADFYGCKNTGNNAAAPPFLGLNGTDNLSSTKPIKQAGSKQTITVATATGDSISVAGGFGDKIAVEFVAGKTLTLADNKNIDVGDKVLLEYCNDNGNSQLVTINTTSGNKTISLVEQPRAQPEYVRKYQMNSYFIATGDSGLPVLKFYDSNGTIYELVDGVENMQITYKVEDSNAYLSASSITETDMNRVNSIKISLLMASTEEVASKPIKYKYDANNDGIAEEITPTDRRLRKIFNSTIVIRNNLQ